MLTSKLHASESIHTAQSLMSNPNHKITKRYFVVICIYLCVSVLPLTACHKATVDPATPTPVARLATETATSMPTTTPAATAATTPTRMPTWTPWPTSTRRPTRTSTATATSTWTPTPTPTVTPTPTGPLPTIPAWSPFQPDSEKAWCWQEIVGLVNALNDVFFIDTQTGWAVGEMGTILHTRNGGETWLRQTSPVNFDLMRVVFVNADIGWITAKEEYSGWVLLRTGDGGQTWGQWPLPSNVDTSIGIVDIAWANERTGWLTIVDQVFHTTDGGQTWERQELPVKGELEAVKCLDEQHAWLSTWREFFRTTDGGKTWTYHLTDFQINDFVFLDAQTGWMTTSGIVFAKTTDGGQTWQEQELSDGYTTWLDRIVFWDKNTGWSLTSYGKLWYTTDGGETWREGRIPSSRSALIFIDAQHGWAVGGTNWIAGTGPRTSIAHTDDGGQTWQFQDQNIETAPLAFRSVEHLTPLLTQPDPPLEALLLQLLPGPCGIEESQWMDVVLYNLGWNGVAWSDPPLEPKSLEMLDIQHLDVDLDQDGENEILLYGGGESCELFAGVLDWDGRQWQTAWFERTGTSDSGNIRVDVKTVGGKPLLQVETLYHPYKGTGELGQSWEWVWVQCEHLNCHVIWRDYPATMNRFCHYCNHYDYSGISYRLIDESHKLVPPAH